MLSGFVDIVSAKRSPVDVALEPLGIPKAIGSRRSGSNCFLIAMYKRTNERRIITPFFQPSCVMKNWAKPEVSHRFFNTSNIYDSSAVTYEIVTRGVPVSTEAPLEVRT